MGNKKLIIIIGILFVITFSLGLIGLLSKDKSINVEPTPIDENIQVISFNNNIRDISSLDEKLSSFEFVKANKEFKSNYIRAYIDNDKVKVDVQKSGLVNPDENAPDIITYTINNITSPVAVQAQMMSSDENKVDAYVLDKYNRFFSVSFRANPSNHEGFEIYYIKLDNIVSFTTLSIPLIENSQVEQIYSVFKTSDGSYYTDYIFDPVDGLKITKINNAAKAENIQNNQ